MDLSNDLISKFVKITNDDKNKNGESTVYGTVVEYNGGMYVRIDGSDLLTPVETTADFKPNERVTVMIKNHSATVTGNITSPATNEGAVTEKVTEAVEEVEGKVITEVEILIADRVSTKQLDAEVARIDELIAGKASVEDLTATNAEITNLKADKASVEDLTATNAEITNLKAEDAKIENLLAGKASIKDLTATNAEITNLKAKDAEITNLVADKASIEDLTATNAEISNLKAKDAEIENLVADKATIKDLTATNAEITNLKAKDAEIENLVADKARIEDLTATNARIDSLQANKADITYLDANFATIDELEAAHADIEILDAELADINTLVNGNLTSDNILSLNITSQNTTMENAFVKDAMIDTVTANKIMSGTIDTNNVTIKSTDGSMLLQGTLLQMKDDNGKVRIQIGKDTGGNFTFILYDESGTGVLIDEEGIKSSDAIADGLIVDAKVADNANIAGSKLDIASVITEVNNDNSTTIKSNKIYLDEQGQSLEVAFNSLKTHVDTIQDVTIDGDLTEVIEQVQSNTTQIAANKEGISTLVSENTSRKEEIQNLDGEIESVNSTLSSKYSSLEQDISGFKTTVADTYTTKSEFNNLQIGGTNLMRYSKPYLLNGKTDVWRGSVSWKTDSSFYGGKEDVFWISASTIARTWVEQSPSWGPDITQGETYAISFDYVRGSSSKGLMIHIYDQNDFYIGMLMDEGMNIPENVVQHREIVWTATYTGKINLCFYNKGSVTEGVNANLLFSSIKIEKGNKATAWSPAPWDIQGQIDATNNNLQNNYSTTSAMNSAIQQKANEITSSVSQTYATKQSVTDVSNNLSANYSTTSAMNSAINQKANEITNSVSQTYATKQSVTDVSNNLATNYSTTSAMNSAINQKANEITSSVRDTYATKQSVTDVSNNLATNYSTTSAMNSAIQQKANEITSSVSETYTTKSEFNNLQIGGRNLAILSNIQGYVGGKLVNNDNNYYSVEGTKIIAKNQPLNSWLIGFKIYTDNSFEYTVSGYTDTSLVALYFICYDKNNTVVQGQTYCSKVVVDGKFILSFNNIPKDTYYFHIGIGNENTANYFIDKLKIEKGNKATDWSPAPEDIQGQIDATNNNLANNYSTTSQMNSAIQQKANEITSSVSETYTTKSEFNNLQIGGTNLMRYSKPYLLNGKTGIWRGTISWGPDSPFYGGKENVFWINLSTTEAKWAQQEPSWGPDITQGETYTISFDYTRGTTSKGLKVNIYDQNDSPKGWIIDEGTDIPANIVQHREIIWTATYTGKINVCFWNKGSMTEGQSSNVLFSSIKIEEGNKATAWSPAPEDVQGQIDATNNNLSANYSTTSAMNSAINQKANEITSSVSQTYATKQSVTDVSNNLSANYSTTSAMNSAIQQKANEITSSVSQTYATKQSVTDVSNNLATNYSTTSAMNSAINQKANEITSSVSQTYTTKSEFNNLQIGGRNLATLSNIREYVGGGLSDNRCYSVEGTKIIAKNQPLNSSVIGFKIYTDNTFEYTVSGYTDTSLIYVFFRCYDKNNTIIQDQTFRTKAVVDGKFISSFNNIPKDTYYFNIGIGNISAANYFIDKLKIEKGNKATDYTPAPEDVQGQIDATNNNLTNNYSTTTQMNSAIQQKANEITSSVSQTYTTKSEFNNLEIGGVNLIRNSTASNNFKDWYIPSDYIDMYEVCYINGSPRGFTADLIDANGRFISTPSLDLTKGETYTLTFWKKNASTSKHWIGIYYTNTSGAIKYITVFDYGDAVNSDFTKYSKQFTMPSDYSSNAELRFYCYSANPTTIIDIKLEKGNKATSWSKHPNDDVMYNVNDSTNLQRYSAPYLLGDNPLNSVYTWARGVGSVVDDTVFGGTCFNLTISPGQTNSYFESKFPKLGGINELIRFEEGVEYTVSLDYSLGKYCSGFQVVFYNEDDSKSQYLDTVYKSDTSQTYKHRYNKTFVAKWSDYAYFLIYNMGVLNSTDTQVVSNLLFSNIKIEKGNKATAWTPAPKDIQGQIDATNNNLQNNYSTTTQMNSAIQQKANEITSSVSQTYATKQSVTDVNNKFSNYSTTTQMNSAIQQKANEINQTVSETYTTKSEFNNLQIGGTNLMRYSKPYLLNGKTGIWKGNGNISWKPDSPFYGGKEDVFWNSTSTTEEKWAQQAVSWGPDVTQGETYTISFDYTRGTSSKGLKVSIYDQNDAHKANIMDEGTEIQANVVQHREIIWTATYTGKINLCFWNKGSITEGVTANLLFSSIKIEKGNKATAWSPAPEDVQGQIDATNNNLSANYSTTSAMNSAINQKANEITSSVSQTYATKQSVTDVNNKFSNYSTTSQMNSAINQKANEITSSVSQTYATKQSVTDVSNNLSTNYSTTSQMNSAINQKANEITSSISETYTTKSEFNNLEIGGTNLMRYSKPYLLNGKTGIWRGNISWKTDSPFYGGKEDVFWNSTSAETESWVEQVTSWGPDVTQGKTYTISFDYTRGGYSKGLRVQIYDQNDTGKVTIMNEGTEIPSNVVQHREIIWTATYTGKVNLCFWNKGTMTAGATANVLFSSIKIEEGNKATAWSPAPEDVQGQIDATNNNLTNNYSTTTQMNSAINQKANEITSSVSSTYATKQSVTDVNNKFNSYTTKSEFTQTTDSITAKFTESGGYNLVRNGGFIFGMNNWSYTSAYLSRGGSINTASGYYIDVTQPYQVKGEPVKIREGRTYIYSARVWYTANTTMGWYSPLNYITTATYSGTTHETGFINHVAKSHETIPGPGWVNIWVVFKCTKSGYFHPVLKHEGITSVISFADVMIMEGNVYKPWTPHPYEVYDGITTIDKTGIKVSQSNYGGYTQMSANGFYVNDGSKNVVSVDTNGLYVQGNITSGSTIQGARITGSTFNSSNDVFQVLEDGTIETSFLAVNGAVSTDKLNVNDIENASYPKVLSEATTVYISPNGGVNAEEFYDGAYFTSLSNMLAVAPRNLNGYTLTIRMAGDLYENAALTWFHSGQVNFEMQGYTLYGYFYGYGASMCYRLYGNTNANNNGTWGHIKPNVGRAMGSYYYAVQFQYCQFAVNYVAVYPSSSSGSSSGGIGVHRGATGIIFNAKACGDMRYLVRAEYAGRVHVNSTQGACNNATFCASTGGIITLNSSNSQAGRSTTGNPYWVGSGGLILCDQLLGMDKITFNNTAQSGSSSSSGSTTRKVTETVKASSADTYRSTVYNNWKGDGTVRQGDYGYGDCQGCWFFGNNLYTTMNAGTVTKVVIRIQRQSGGVNGLQTLTVKSHNHTSRPSGAPTYTDTIGTCSCAVGSHIDLVITDSTTINKLKNCKGLGLSIGSASSPYAVCSGACSVIITYTTNS